MGRVFYAEGILRDPRHIFYLTREEIFSYIEGAAVSQDLAALAGFRIAEYERFKTLPAPPERFATYGPAYHCADFGRFARLDPVEGNLQGIGCCPGKIKGTVRV